MAFYTGGLRLLLFTNLVLVTVIKEEGEGGGEGEGRGRFFSSARNERRIIYDLEEAVTEKRGGEKRKRGVVFASVGKRASLRVSFRNGNSLFGLGVIV